MLMHSHIMDFNAGRDEVVEDYCHVYHCYMDPVHPVPS